MTRYRCYDCMWGPCTVIARADSSPPPRCLWAEPDDRDPPGYFEELIPMPRPRSLDWRMALVIQWQWQHDVIFSWPMVEFEEDVACSE